MTSDLAHRWNWYWYIVDETEESWMSSYRKIHDHRGHHSDAKEANVANLYKFSKLKQKDNIFVRKFLLINQCNLPSGGEVFCND